MSDDDNVVPLITRKTLGIDQLEQFDRRGVPGPGVTSAMAFAKVRELSIQLAAAKKLLRESLGWMVPSETTGHGHFWNEVAKFVGKDERPVSDAFDNVPFEPPSE